MKITPKQAFDSIKVLFPETVQIKRRNIPVGSLTLHQKFHENHCGINVDTVFYPAIMIDWGVAEKYPESESIKNPSVDILVFKNGTIAAICDGKQVPELQQQNVSEVIQAKAKSLGYDVKRIGFQE
jgi:hypothetical protein